MKTKSLPIRWKLVNWTLTKSKGIKVDKIGMKVYQSGIFIFYHLFNYTVGQAFPWEILYGILRQGI